MELCVLIPAKNEALSLPATILDICNTLNENVRFNILIVNDHSDDDTSDILNQFSNTYNNVFFVNNQFVPGVGNAISYGLEQWKGDVVVITMADASDDPNDILTSFNTLVKNGYDCVFGSRWIKGGKVEGYPINKLILNRIFNELVKILTRNKYNDFTNLFKMYSRTAINNIKPIESTGFSIGLEMSLKSFSKNLKIGIVPISWKKRSKGQSKLSLLKNIRLFAFTLMKSLRKPL